MESLVNQIKITTMKFIVQTHGQLKAGDSTDFFYFIFNFY